MFYHSPNKTLIYVVHLPDIGDVRTKDEYRERYAQLIASRGGGFLTVKDVGPFGNAVILNDYETFAEKVYHTVLAL